ncbi:hypothetical protein F5Y18DRAFT_378338 [Xylariaceae sp. FL1019]|nr:hypothetical protein F5Y18DRAFT_378338 [Xylariaceae sp. FL1019]
MQVSSILLHTPTDSRFAIAAMSTTPQTMSPAKAPHTPDRNGVDQSMMVEPPTQIQIDQSPPQDETVRLHTDAQDSRRQQIHEDQVPEHQYRAQTPETQKRQSAVTTSPGHLADFDWENFEARYREALEEADANERQMLEKFEHLVKYFNVWASAASSHDNERAVKRLQTRQRYVRLEERSLQQKKQHLTEVVNAFQSALALLSTSS